MRLLSQLNSRLLLVCYATNRYVSKLVNGDGVHLEVWLFSFFRGLGVAGRGGGWEGGDCIKLNDDHLTYFCEQFQVLM